MRVHGPILSLALLALLALPSVAAAQHAQCTPFDNVADHRGFNTCNAAIDAGEFFHPLLGLAISGGNPVVGSFRTFGGLGHLSVGVRFTAFETATPKLNYDGVSSTVPEGKKIPLGAPTLDVGLGVYRGLSHGLLAVDLLGSMVALPNNLDNLYIDSSASSVGSISYKIGYGARIGILRGGFPIPSVNASWMHREVPTARVGDVDSTDNFSYQLSLKSTSLRLTAGWKLALLEFGGGVGRDHYTGDAVMRFLNPVTSVKETVSQPLDETRTTLFADVGLSLSVLRIGGEIGMQTDNELTTVSQFQGIDVKKGRKYASATFRLQF